MEKWDHETYIGNAKESTLTNATKAPDDGKVGCHTIVYTTAFPYSDWLHYIWHGIKAISINLP